MWTAKCVQFLMSARINKNAIARKYSDRESMEGSEPSSHRLDALTTELSGHLLVSYVTYVVYTATIGHKDTKYVKSVTYGSEVQSNLR